MEINKSKGVIESILFSAGREVKITELMSALEASSEEIITVVESMKEDYKNGRKIWPCGCRSGRSGTDDDKDNSCD